jgi:integrase
MKSYKTSQLKIFNNNGKEYIYVYYKENNVALRINTRYEYVKNKMTTDNLYNSKMKNHEKINTEIREIQYAVDTYINLIGGHKPINQKECMEYVKEHKYDAIKAPASKAIILTSLSDYYEKFLDSKKSLPFLKPISLKNYVSFKNFLKDLQKYKKQRFYLFHVNKDLINLMITFSQIDLRDLDGYVSKGHLQINTVKKRLDVFKEFLIWLEAENIAKFNIRSLFPKIEKTYKEIVYITNKEIENLIETRSKIEGEYNKLVFDSFIFNCECGLRFQDLSHLNKSDFTKIPDGYILKIELHKHTERFATESLIPIVNPLLIQIIEQYNFHFDLKANSLYNRTLRNLFKQHDLFTEPLTVKKRYVIDDLKEEKLKNDVITCHSCRRSMITNAFLDGYTDAQIMQMSGHKNLRTLQKYSNFANDELLNKNLNQKLQKMKTTEAKK